MRSNFFEGMSKGIKGCFFQKKSRSASGVILACRDSFVFSEGETGDFEEGLPDHDIAEMSDTRSAEPTSNNR